jgi:PAS domain S-box-containing protein
VFVGLVAHAIIRHRLMDLRLVVHRSLTLGLAMLLSLVPVGALVVAFWPRLAGRLEAEELLVLLTAVVIVTLLAPPARDVARRLLDRYVYRTYANYQRTVREASRMLTRVLDLKRLLSFIGNTVATSTGAEGVAIYLRDEDGLRLALREHRADNASFTAPEIAPVEIVSALDTMKEPIVAEELAHHPAPDELRAAVDRLLALDWALVLPVISEEKIIAFITLGPKLSGDPYYPQDLDLLMTLANQAGIAVKNARLYAEVVLAREYIESIVATIESGVVAVTASGRVTMFNPSAERLTGLAARDVIDRSVDALPACLGTQLTAAVADGYAHTRPEIELPDASAPADGPTTRPVMCTTSPLRDPEGVILGAVAVFSDLTPFKELEIERQRAERIAYFEMLGSTIAHEIKNPLVAIKTFVQLVPRRRDDNRWIEDFSRITTRQIQRMEELLDRLRALSRPAERPLHPLDLRLPIGEAMEFLAPPYAEKRVTLSAALGETVCTVLGDHAELVQVCLNLLMNALEVSAPGGIVRVELARSDSHVRVSVADTGPGIPAELLQRIFDPFFTTKERGTGLGLAVSAQIAQTHGARLRAANRPSGGAIFTLEFPATVIAAAAVRA